MLTDPTLVQYIMFSAQDNIQNNLKTDVAAILFSGVKSQLHTPLTAKQSEDGAIAAVAMPSVRREAAERNPLDLVKQTSVGRLSSSGESQGYPQKNPVDLLLQNFLTNCR